MKVTTSKRDSVEADIRFCPSIDFENPIKFKRIFLGLHLDFSMRQVILYLCPFYLFMEFFPPDRSSWGYATIDHADKIWSYGRFTLQKHGTNHIPDHFFNIGITFELGKFGGGYQRDITIFFWKWQFVILVDKMENKS